MTGCSGSNEGGGDALSFEQSAGEAWPQPTNFPPHPGSTLHLWRIDLARLKDSSLEIELLSVDEVDRANRLRSDEDRWRFETSRVTLRKILGAYLERAPTELVFEYGETGKPTLKAHPQDGESTSLSFNVSHSGQVALCAVAGKGAVGGDVEQIRELRATDRIARRHFSPEELEEWLVLDASDRLTEFYGVWTRKEALIKASGLGLSWPLKRVDSIRGIIEQKSFWVNDVNLGRKFTGAVACETAPSEVRLLSL